MNDAQNTRKPVTPVLMARLPELGTAKTRLQADGTIPPEIVTHIANAMLRTVAQRLISAFGHLIVAGTPDEAEPQFRNGPLQPLDQEAIRFIPQGSGDLGDRIGHIWNTVGTNQPLAFLGMDSPDMPADGLAHIQPIIEQNRIAVGPSNDGGYWAIACPRLTPSLFRQIDWGTDRVYHQTCEQGREAGLTIEPLVTWDDVDHPADLDALRQRLRADGREPDSALDELAARLDELLGP